MLVSSFSSATWCRPRRQRQQGRFPHPRRPPSACPRWSLAVVQQKRVPIGWYASQYTDTVVGEGAGRALEGGGLEHLHACIQRA